MTLLRNTVRRRGIASVLGLTALLSACTGTYTYDAGTGSAFLTILYFFFLVIFFWLLITMFADIFRREDLSGWAKAGWTILIIFLPLLGILIYLIARPRHLEQDKREAEAYRITVIVGHFKRLWFSRRFARRLHRIVSVNACNLRILDKPQIKYHEDRSHIVDTNLSEGFQVCDESWCSQWTR